MITSIDLMQQQAQIKWTQQGERSRDLCDPPYTAHQDVKNALDDSSYFKCSALYYFFSRFLDLTIEFQEILSSEIILFYLTFFLRFSVFKGDKTHFLVPLVCIFVYQECRPTP